MAMSKKQASVIEAINGKVQYMLTTKRPDIQADLLIKKTIQEINGLIVTHKLAEDKKLIDRIEGALVRLKKFGLASSFRMRHKKK